MFNAMKLTQVLNLVIGNLGFSDIHNVLWRTVVFEPLCDQVPGYFGTLLVDETGGLALTAVLLDIDRKNVAVADDFRGCYPWTGQPAMFNCINPHRVRSSLALIVFSSHIFFFFTTLLILSWWTWL